MYSMYFFFNDTTTPEIYTLSLHDALPISLDEHFLEEHVEHLHRCRRGVDPPEQLLAEPVHAGGALEVLDPELAEIHLEIIDEAGEHELHLGDIFRAFQLGRRSEERRVGEECRSRWWPVH